jgi:hypothetical protein
MKDLMKACESPDPAYDTDIRVGDLVQVVALDSASMREAEQFRRDNPNKEPDQPRPVAAPGYINNVDRYESARRDGGADYVRFLGNRYAWGRFRILERDGEPYERAGRLVVAPRTTGDALVPVIGSAPAADPCAWCSSESCTGARALPYAGRCGKYQVALEERLAIGGTNDCEAERESVRRFVDAREPRRRCACGAELMGALARADRQCGDCRRTAERDRARVEPRTENSLDERITEAQPPSESERDPTSGWSAGATPSAEWP